MRHLRQIYESKHNRIVAPEILKALGGEREAQAFERALASGDLVAGLEERTDWIATIIEASLNRKDLPRMNPNELDFASALRVYGPEDARRGEPLEWRAHGSITSAVDDGGTGWDIVAGGRAGAYGLIVAAWDSPDWYTDTLEEAKLLAAEIVVRPKFGEAREIEQPYD